MIISILLISPVLFHLTCLFHGILILPFLAIYNFLNDLKSERFRLILLSGFCFISKAISYYIMCFWPALVVYLVVIPRLPEVSIWWYGAATIAFLSSGCIDFIMILVFMIFCYNPILISKLYGWLPLYLIYNPLS